jgi:hypothetical protein
VRRSRPSPTTWTTSLPRCWTPLSQPRAGNFEPAVS